jgi:glycosyltransferase involved in cell wall biosynthesis
MSTGSESIVFVDHTAEPGGAELALARHLENSGMQNCVIVSDRGKLTERWSRAANHVSSLQDHENGPFSALRFIRRELKTRRSAIVISNSMRAALYVSLSKTRDQVHVYYLRDSLRRESLSWLKRILVRLIVLPRSHAVIANSSWTASTLPVGSHHTPFVCRSASGIKSTNAIAKPVASTPLRVVSLSRIVPWKGIDVLIDALTILSATGSMQGIHVVIAGAATLDDGRYEQEMKRRASQIDLQISFPGHVDDISTLLRPGDILVHTPVVPEPLGQVILQGMAAGMAVISVDAGGPAELIEHQVTGHLMPESSPRHLVSALKDLIANPATRMDLGREAAAAASQMSDERCAAELDDVIKRIAEQYRIAAPVPKEQP